MNDVKRCGRDGVVRIRTALAISALPRDDAAIVTAMLPRLRAGATTIARGVGLACESFREER